MLKCQLLFALRNPILVLSRYNIFMKRKIRQRWSATPPIPTKRTITSRLSPQITDHRKDHDTVEPVQSDT